MDGPSSTGRSLVSDGPQRSMRSGHAGTSYAGSTSSNRDVSLQSRQSFSSIHVNQEDVGQYGQSLASVLNNPRLGKSGIYNNDASWGTWLFHTSGDPHLELTPPPLPSGALPEISKANFQPYLDSVSEAYSRFADVRQHSSWEQSNEAAAVAAEGSLEGEVRGGQGEGLVACLREIPSLYFDEDFALEKGSTFQAACPFSSIPQNMMLQEKLSQYLDLVEVHLVREISARSNSFFEALDQLEDLNGRIVGACEEIRELQAAVHLLDGDLVESARHIQGLATHRDNMLALHQKLKLVVYANQAISALRLLVAAADCAGALDVIDDLQHLLEGDELVGLHCFRHLGSQLGAALESVNSTLAADFVREAIHETADLESNAIVAKLNGREKELTTFKDLVPSKDQVHDDEEGGLRDQLLPIVIGLLRTSKLPAVLRVYRDTLITDIKAAIKTVVAELLPILFTHPIDGGDFPSADRQTDMEVGGISLAFKLRGLSAENFVRLLSAVFSTVQARLLRAAEVRIVIEQIIGGLQGSYAAEAVAAAFASGAAAVAAADAAQEGSPGSFRTLAQDSSSTSSTLGRASSATSISRQFRADMLRENTEAVCAACDAAHGRWAKLLGVRALIHPKLRLQEFVSIYEITQDFISATEKVGGRLGYSIRGTLQSQSKLFVDNQHSTRMSKIVAVLEQETWAAIDAPDEFQAIVDSFTATEAPSNGNLYTSEEVSLARADSLDQTVSDTTQSPIIEETLVLESDISQANGTVVTKETPAEIPAIEGAEAANGGMSKRAPLPPGSSPGDIILSDAPVAKGKKVREKTSVKTLQIRGTGYHCVNCGLILLKMIAEYLDISSALPALATEVVHRVAEILKLFNSRSCQLVLGAGAMQVSGLKSITAKHLALASQSISFFYALIPDIRRLLAIHIPEARKALLLTEIDRVGQDYRVHRDEIHSKLVAIMKERLLVHLRTLPQIVETWNRADDGDTQPSQFARALTKEVGVLHRVLSPLLLDADVRSIFTRVVLLFHSQLADSFSKLDVNTPQAKRRLCRDVQHILACVRGLPSDAVSPSGAQKAGELDEFLLQRFGSEQAVLSM